MRQIKCCGGHSDINNEKLSTQILATLSFGCMSGVSFGALMGFSSVFLAQIKNSDNEILTITPQQEVLMVSVFVLLKIPGLMVGTVLLPRLGRLKQVSFALPFMALGWLLVAFGQNFAMLLTGRIFLGFTLSLVSPAASIYIGEVTSPSIRGILLLCPILMSSVGLLIMYGTGSVLNWRYASLIAGLTPITIMFIASLLLPKSARWLLVSGKNEDEARKSIEFYRGKKFDVSKEIESIRASLQNDKNNVRKQECSNLLHWQYVHPLLLVIFQFMFNGLSGTFVLFQFASEIFTEAGAGSNHYINSMYIALTRMAGGVLSGYFIEKVGRVKLLTVAGMLCSISMAVNGAYFWSETLQNYPYIAVISFSTFTLTFSLGPGPVTWVLMGEMLPTPIRSVGSNIVLIFYAISEFVIVQFYRDTNRVFGVYTTFWIYAGVNLTQVLFDYFLVPETRGKSLEQIQSHFIKDNTSAKCCADSENNSHLGIN